MSVDSPRQRMTAGRDSLEGLVRRERISGRDSLFPHDHHAVEDGHHEDGGAPDERHEFAADQQGNDGNALQFQKDS